MTQVPLGKSAYDRQTAGEPEIRLENRFFETNPTNLATGTALLSRPGTTFLANFGDGPIRSMFTQPGAFDDALFIVSGADLYRYDTDGTTTLISGIVAGGASEPEMAVMKGAGYEYLFIADGLLFQFYPGGSHARGVLTESGAIAAQAIAIEGIYYQWAVNVNAGTPDGTVGSPYLVLVGASDEESLANMAAALTYSGVRGTTYSNTLGGPHPYVTVPYGDAPPTATTLTVEALSEFAAGNAITTTSSGAGIAWGGPTLTGGGTHALSGVATPDGAAISSIAALASHIIAVVANSQRFYWLPPGETTIDPSHFAEAESKPDNIVSVRAVGDQAWFLGKDATEAWYATGDPDTAFAPIQGRAYARGVIEGTAVQVLDTVILVGDDLVVYAIGAGIQRVSTHGIEERIRRQVRREAGL